MKLYHQKDWAVICYLTSGRWVVCLIIMMHSNGPQVYVKKHSKHKLNVKIIKIVIFWNFFAGPDSFGWLKCCLKWSISLLVHACLNLRYFLLLKLFKKQRKIVKIEVWRLSLVAPEDKNPWIHTINLEDQNPILLQSLFFEDATSSAVLEPRQENLISDCPCQLLIVTQRLQMRIWYRQCNV